MSKTSSSPSGKAVATGGVLLTACAVCCAPLVVPFLAAFFAAGGVGLALAGQIGLGIAALGAVGGYLYLRRRVASKRAGSCGCGPIGGCADAGQAQRDPRA
ncbi:MULTISPECIES: hypothetical protein [Halomonas]|jgi:hypothetical protein|uniref:Mercuric ion transport protein n=1 Tax=Halomonas alimentaria TaxID=147248 RepID=A0A7X4W3P5_9GAMM|nr:MULTISPECIES: hypothetical protein [Halomonas]NAW33749.1 hypothetical protein [Halomonas alimentaria]